MRDEIADGPIPPFSIEIEQALIGALFVEADAIEKVADILDPDHFYEPLHQRLYEMTRHLATEGPVSPVVVHAVMGTDRELAKAGGLSYLADLSDACPALPDVIGFARIIIGLAARRTAMRITEDLVEALADTQSPRPAVEIIADYSERLLRVGEGQQKGPLALADVGDDALKDVETRRNSLKPKGVSTGLLKLDDALGGMQPGDRIAIAARTGMGKSLAASGIALAAAKHGAPVFVASADMRAQQWSNRALCDIDMRMNPHETPIFYSKFRKGTLSNSEIGRLALANNELRDWPIEIDDNPRVTLASFRGRARAMARRFPGEQGVAILDFLQKVEPPSKSGRDRRRDEDLTMISYALGDIVRDIGWTLVALVQLINKTTDSKGKLREDPPSVADIRESGGIEMAFDIIVSPFRKAFFLDRHEPTKYDCAGGITPEWHEWNGKAEQERHNMRLLGFKNRDGRAADLDLDLWCEPGACAVRDEDPKKAQPTADLLAMAV